MGKIKTFKGAGPNPNIPFARLPGINSVGAVENAIGGVAATYEKAAIQYKKNQEKLETTRQVDDAELARVKTLNESRTKNFDEQTGIYDTDSIKAELSLADGIMKADMNEKAYEAYSRKNAIRTELELQKLNSINETQTRKNNLNAFSENMDERSKLLSTATFDDMKQIVSDMRDSTLANVSSGVPESTAFKIYNENVAKSVKSFVDLSIGTSAESFSDLNTREEKLKSFLEQDPLGVFSKNPGERDRISQELDTYYDRQSDSLQSKNVTAARRRDSLESATRLKNYRGLEGKFISAYGIMDQGERAESLLQLQEEAEEAYAAEEISTDQFNRLSNMDFKLQGAKDKSLRTKMKLDPDKAVDYFSDMSVVGQEKYRSDFENSVGAPNAYKNALKMFKETTKSMSYGLSDSISAIETQEEMANDFDVNFKAAAIGKTKTPVDFVVLKTLKDNLNSYQFEQFIYNKVRSLQSKSTKNLPDDKVKKFLLDKISELDSKVLEFNNKGKEVN